MTKRDAVFLVKVGGGALLLAALLAIGPAIWWSNYKECRAHGFSKTYCFFRR